MGPLATSHSKHFPLHLHWAPSNKTKRYMALTDICSNTRPKHIILQHIPYKAEGRQLCQRLCPQWRKRQLQCRMLGVLCKVLRLSGFRVENPQNPLRSSRPPQPSRIFSRHPRSTLLSLAKSQVQRYGTCGVQGCHANAIGSSPWQAAYPGK